MATHSNWYNWYIHCDLQVEAAIVEELAALGLVATPERPHPRPPTFDDFGSMKMLGAAVKEALRLLPVSCNAWHDSSYASP